MNRAERRRAGRLHSVPTHRLAAQINSYRELKVIVPNPDVSDQDLAEEVDRKRWEYGELVMVTGRPAQTGDLVTLDVEGSRDGEQADELSSPAYSGELGKAALSEVFDNHIVGLSVGDVTTFDCPLGAETVRFTVTLNEIQQRTPLDLTDESVTRISSASTVEQWSEQLRTEMSNDRKARARQELPNGCVEQLSHLVGMDELSLRAISEEVQRQKAALLETLEKQGHSFDEHLELLKQTPEEFNNSLRTNVTTMLRAHIALLALAEKESLEATAEEIKEAKMQIAKQKAVKWLTENVEIVDKDGQPVDRELLN